MAVSTLTVSPRQAARADADGAFEATVLALGRLALQLGTRTDTATENVGTLRWEDIEVRGAESVAAMTEGVPGRALRQSASLSCKRDGGTFEAEVTSTLTSLGLTQSVRLNQDGLQWWAILANIEAAAHVQRAERPPWFISVGAFSTLPGEARGLRPQNKVRYASPGEPPAGPKAIRAKGDGTFRLEALARAEMEFAREMREARKVAPVALASPMPGSSTTATPRFLLGETSVGERVDRFDTPKNAPKSAPPASTNLTLSFGAARDATEGRVTARIHRVAGGPHIRSTWTDTHSTNGFFEMAVRSLERAGLQVTMEESDESVFITLVGPLAGEFERGE